MANPPSDSVARPNDARHPPGLYTLFFTEMWERFSYYGMRALLVLFMVAGVEKGGMALDEQTANAIYGLYTAAVYLVALPGGWLADRWLGARRAVWNGGWLIAAGHICLALPHRQTFFVGLGVIVLGTSLLKPNISAMVGQLYPEGGARRDAGFTIFYVGINLGAALGPALCGRLAERVGWHAGFGVAAVGMLLGLAQYRWMGWRLANVGAPPPASIDAQPGSRATTRHLMLAAVVGLAIVSGLALALAWLGPVILARYSIYLIVAVLAGYFAWIFDFGRLSALESRRVAVLVVLMAAASLFFTGFEQAGSSFTLFAERFTNRHIAWLNDDIPTAWFQSLNPIFIIALSPLFAALWKALGRRRLDPSTTAKFAFGLLQLGLAMMVMAWAASLATRGTLVSPNWLVATYFLQTMAELCLSPVGLSAVTKLAPARFVGQMMGMWFAATALGNLLAAQFASRALGDGEPIASGSDMAETFVLLGAITLSLGLSLLLAARPLGRWSGASDS